MQHATRGSGESIEERRGGQSCTEGYFRMIRSGERPITLSATHTSMGQHMSERNPGVLRKNKMFRRDALQCVARTTNIWSTRRFEKVDSCLMKLKAFRQTYTYIRIFV